VEQISAAIRDGVDVFGYLYWSLMDNWEWISHYRPESRHGLFSVNRRTPEFPRCMTDGGMALCHLVAENGIGQARERFGSFTAGGTAIKCPSMSAGRLYAGRLTHDERHQEFELYLSARADGSLIGLLHYFPASRGVASGLWVRLENLGRGPGWLTFSHSRIPGRVGPADYGIAIAADPLLIDGQAKMDGLDWQLAAVMQPLGFYKVPAAGKGDPRLLDGTLGIGGSAWAPQIITSYEHNSGLSNARQLVETWQHTDCTLEGALHSSARIRLELLPSIPHRSGLFADPVTRHFIFTGSSLVSATGDTVFERAPDGVGT